jgi:hypothetical protein
MTGC